MSGWLGGGAGALWSPTSSCPMWWAGRNCSWNRGDAVDFPSILSHAGQQLLVSAESFLVLSKKFPCLLCAFLVRHNVHMSLMLWLCVISVRSKEPVLHPPNLNMSHRARMRTGAGAMNGCRWRGIPLCQPLGISSTAAGISTNYGEVYCRYHTQNHTHIYLYMIWHKDATPYHAHSLQELQWHQ